MEALERWVWCIQHAHFDLSRASKFAAAILHFSLGSSRFSPHVPIVASSDQEQQRGDDEQKQQSHSQTDQKVGRQGAAREQEYWFI